MPYVDAFVAKSDSNLLCFFDVCAFVRCGEKEIKVSVVYKKDRQKREARIFFFLPKKCVSTRAARA